jgi:hypothetical protein
LRSERDTVGVVVVASTRRDRAGAVRQNPGRAVAVVSKVVGGRGARSVSCSRILRDRTATFEMLTAIQWVAGSPESAVSGVMIVPSAITLSPT